MHGAAGQHADEPHLPAAMALQAPALPARPVDDILVDHADLIRRIRLCFGLDRENWNAEVLPLMPRLLYTRGAASR